MKSVLRASALLLLPLLGVLAGVADPPMEGGGPPVGGAPSPR